MSYELCLAGLLQGQDNLKPSDIADWTTDEKGKLLTALIQAGGGQALTRFSRSLELLMCNKPNLDYQEEQAGLTPMMMAIRTGDAGMKHRLLAFHSHPEPLLRLDMNVNLRCYNNLSAIDWSVRAGDHELAETLAQLKTQPQKGIRVLSLDFDGCIFHEGYLSSPVKDPVLHNQPFLEALKEGNDAYSKIIVMAGTVRQSWADDQFNANRDTGAGLVGSCYPAMQQISLALGAECDGFLLADVYGGRVSGLAFDRAIQALQSGHNMQHDGWVHDSSKISILYAQMHKIALEYPSEVIHLDFYDDRLDILHPLAAFFEANRNKMPANVRLRMHYYQGGLIQPYHPIQGTGIININFRETVKNLGYAADLYGRTPDGLQRKVNLIPEAKLQNAFFNCIAYVPIQLPPAPVVLPVTVTSASTAVAHALSRKRAVLSELAREDSKRIRHLFFDTRVPRDEQRAPMPGSSSGPGR